MMTSGFKSAIHFFEGSKPLNTGAQYGVSVLPLSHAAPMAGTCETLTLAMILATLFGLRLVDPLGLAAITVDGAASLEHHLRILLLGEAGHGGRDMLERQTIGGKQLGEEVDVTAELDHAPPIARQDRR